MFRAIALTCVLAFHVPALACQALLRSPLLKIGTSYSLSRQALKELNRQELSPTEFSRIIGNGQAFAMGDSSRFWTIVFRTDRRHLDQGLLVTGYRSGKTFMIERIHRANARDESDYFKAVARMHGMETKIVHLKKSIMKCEDVYVQSWIQAKLWLKHHLNPEEIPDLLYNAGEPEADFNHSAGGPRYVFKSQTPDLNFKVVLANDGPCPHPVITAFEIH